MSNIEFSLKELYEVRLKTTYPIEIDGYTFDKNETIAFFDKIQIANIDEIKKWVSAHGGFDDRPHVIWEDTKEVNIKFTQGIFSKTQFALLSNAKLLHYIKDSKLTISNREELESNEKGEFSLKERPYSELFIYDKESNQKLEYGIQDKLITIRDPYKEVIVDYNFLYSNNFSRMKLGHCMIEGFLCLEGRTRTKDDITGYTKTAIIKIPKLKLMSELSIKLGEKADPVIGNFEVSAFPVGDRGNKNIFNIYFLEDDIDSDI